MNNIGFTVNELIVCFFVLSFLGLVGGGIYTIVHFIAKVW